MDNAQIRQNRRVGQPEGVGVSDRPPAALSPLDGRYWSDVEGLAGFFSEEALNRTRLEVEVEWLIELCTHGVAGVDALSAGDQKTLRAIALGFDAEQAAQMKEIEATTQHDVKAVEYYLRGQLEAAGLSHLSELVHFAATSEDINNVSYALMVSRSVHDIWLPAVQTIIDGLRERAQSWRDVPMLSRTHGQAATPTTFGKELAVFAHRLGRVVQPLHSLHLPAKINGATGTFSAHHIAWPDTDWVSVSKGFIERLGLEWNPLTTQIESHDGLVALFHQMSHVGTIAHNLCTDIWTYISLGYLRQIPVKGATGSSTMPHKVNPIRFENAEANLEIAGGLLQTLASTLGTSRLQRDLTDSSTQRNIGVAMGHQMVAWANIARGLGQVDIAPDVMAADLESTYEVLAEAIQTVIRAEIAAGTSSISDPYDVVKQLTRGASVTAQSLKDFVSGLDISDTAKARLLELTPATYTGLASRLVDEL